MPNVSTAEFIPYSPRQMFELVNDIEAYPQFLPWCAGASVEHRSKQSVVASLRVAKGPLQHSFTTENKLNEFERIDMSLVEGPFKRFGGAWHFREAPGGCRVSLDLDFEFSNRLLASTLSKVFKLLTGSMVQAFRDRARHLYG